MKSKHVTNRLDRDVNEKVQPGYRGLTLPLLGVEQIQSNSEVIPSKPFTF